MKELRAHADTNKTTIAKIMLANEMSIAGRSEAEVYAFVDKIINAMVATVKSGLSMPEDDVLPGPIKLHSKAATVYKRAMDDKYQADRGIGALSAFAIAASEENGRGHLVITAPTGGSAGVMPALVYGLLEVRKVDRQKVRDGMLAAAAVGYLCKHHATLSAAEGGCQAEIGVASSMAAALAATAYDAESRVVENAAESALEHHLGMTCDPVAGYVQVPCIERCAFGAVKAWTAYAIASNEIASRHRVDFDATVMALAANREGHEQQVQGDQRSWSRPLRRALLDRMGLLVRTRCQPHGSPRLPLAIASRVGWLTCRYCLALASASAFASRLLRDSAFTQAVACGSRSQPPTARSASTPCNPHRLPHRSATTSGIGMASSSGKPRTARRCRSC